MSVNFFQKKYCIVLASGTGLRFGADCPKQFVKINGKMIIEYTLRACDCGIFDKLILVVSKPYVDEMKKWVGAAGFGVPIQVVEGGMSRMESCERGLSAVEGEGVVIVHNGVQPFVTRKSFENCFQALSKYDAVTCGVKCVYTALVTNDSRILVDAPDRSKMFSDMGPEGFRITFLRHVLEVGRDDKISTGLCGVVLRNRLGDVYVADGEPGNIKITYKEDLIQSKCNILAKSMEIENV